jgi:hypothetical protein
MFCPIELKLIRMTGRNVDMLKGIFIKVYCGLVQWMQSIDFLACQALQIKSIQGVFQPFCVPAPALSADRLIGAD